jgi:Na+(H+)/acetate symporter ActP
MWQQALLNLGLSSFVGRSDGIAVTTTILLIILAFWTGLLVGVVLTFVCVSPSLRQFLRKTLVDWLSDDGNARHRLSRYRLD